MTLVQSIWRFHDNRILTNLREQAYFRLSLLSPKQEPQKPDALAGYILTRMFFEVLIFLHF